MNRRTVAPRLLELALVSTLVSPALGCSPFRSIGIEQRGAHLTLLESGTEIAEPKAKVAREIVSEVNSRRGTLAKTSATLVEKAFAETKRQVDLRMLAKNRDNGRAQLRDLTPDKVFIERHRILDHENEAELAEFLHSRDDWARDCLGEIERPENLPDGKRMYVRLDARSFAYPRSPLAIGGPTPSTVFCQSSVQYYSEVPIGSSVASELTTLLREQVIAELESAALKRGLDTRQHPSARSTPGPSARSSPGETGN